MFKRLGFFQRRAEAQSARRLVRDRELLASLSAGGAPAHPIAVASAAVIGARSGNLPCVQCGGEYRIDEHAAPIAGLRRVDVTCRRCCMPRSLWFRIAPADSN